MRKIIFRCDASLNIGSGHVIRCRTLARELKYQGADILFVCRQQPGDLITLLESEFQVLKLPMQLLRKCIDLGGERLYEAWLGCTQNQDAQDVLSVIKDHTLSDIDWIVTDHYGIDHKWEQVILSAFDIKHKSRPRILAIDDLANRFHQADLLLDQNFFGFSPETRYQGLVPNSCHSLLGPEYALLGPEYCQLRRSLPRRTQKERVLVFFGGVDPDNLTGITLEALMKPSLAHLHVDIVLGRQSVHRASVAKMANCRPLTTIHEPLPSLVGLIARADFAIGAAGTTSWERSCLKLPSLSVVIADNQMESAQYLAKTSHTRLLGTTQTVTKEIISSAIECFIDGTTELDADQDLTDGFGTYRVALAMLGPRKDIRLREAEAEDEALLLHWANKPEVRLNSFSPNPISKKEHREWFHKSLNNPNRLILIAITTDDCPVGQIRFDRCDVQKDVLCCEILIDISLDGCARGFGLSPRIIEMGIGIIRKRWGKNLRFLAEVLVSNNASNACFEKAGFSQAPTIASFAANRATNLWHKQTS